ncbi:MAG: hypothetical protein ABI045_06040 [Flavobacteriales bacterium]
MNWDVLNDETVQNLTYGRDWIPELNMRNIAPRNIAPYTQLKLNLYRDWVFKGGIHFEDIVIKLSDHTTLYQIDSEGNPKGSVFVQGIRLR